MLPESLQLPPPHNRYTEQELAESAGYRWTDWILIHPTLREEILAHKIHKGMREAYNSEMLRKKSKGAKDTGSNPADHILSFFRSKKGDKK